MRRLILWTTVLSGAIAAYLMFKRGESLRTIATEAGSNPVGSLLGELKRV